MNYSRNVIFSILVIAFVLLIPTAFAEPIEYEVQIIVEDIVNLNFDEEWFDAFIWIIITSDDADFTLDPPPLQFPNGIVLDYLQESELTTIAPHRYVAKIFGTFGMKADYHNYPYEILEMPIILQIHDKDVSQIILKLSPDSKNYKIDAPGLIFLGNDVDLRTESFYDGKTYSQIVSTSKWEYPTESIFLQEIFPLLVIAGIAIFLLRFQPKNLEHKAGAAVGLVFSLIAFYALVIAERLPPLEYLTFEEKLIIIDYVLIAFLLVEVLVQQRYNKNDDVKTREINKKMTYLLPVVIAIVSAGLLLV